MDHRAYAVLTIKATSDEGGKRRFKGIATTPGTDRVGDIVEPDGATFKLPLPLLWQHNSREPIGWVKEAKVSKAGIEVDCEIADIEEEGNLRSRLLEAWQTIKAGLVRGLSIGFRPIEYSEIKGTWNTRFIKWEWLELSAVTIPANADANIHTIKSLDEQQRAALGQAPPRDRPPPGVSGTTSKPASRGFSFSRKESAMGKKTVAEQIKEFEATRMAKTARMQEIMQAAMDEGRGTNEAEAEEYDGLGAEVRSIDADLRRARELEKLIVANAQAVDTRANSGESRGPIVFTRKDQEDKFAGQSFVRKIIAKAAARLLDTTATHIAMERWGKTNPTLVEVIKVGEVPGGGTGAGEWGSELVTADNRFAGDFIEFLYGRTVFDRLPLRTIPANVMIKGEDGAATAYWVGESKAIPATAADFFNVSLTPLKVAALAVVSNDLIRYSSPDAEMLVRDALVQASAQRIDTTFLSTGAAVAGVAPAGILNGLTGITPAGTDAASLRADVRSLYAPFITAKNAAPGLVFVTTPSLEKSIQLMTNALGQPEFAGMQGADRNLLGDGVFSGDNVPAGALILLRPGDIYRIGDTGVEVSISREAMIEQNTAPTGATDTPVAASATMTSMFQEDSTAIKVVRHINFAKRRASAVAFVTGAAYTG